MIEAIVLPPPPMNAAPRANSERLIPDDPVEQQRPSPGAVEEAQGDDSHPDVDDADPDRGDDRPGAGVDPGELDDRRRVVDHRVYPGDLLQDRQPDADHQRRLDHRLEQLVPAPGLSSMLSLISASSRSIVSGSSTRILARVARAA